MYVCVCVCVCVCGCVGVGACISMHACAHTKQLDSQHPWHNISNSMRQMTNSENFLLESPLA